MNNRDYLKEVKKAELWIANRINTALNDVGLRNNPINRKLMADEILIKMLSGIENPSFKAAAKRIKRLRRAK